MAQITLGTLDVRVAPGMSYEIEHTGDYGRAFSGKMRSDLRGHYRVFRITTPPLETDDMTALRLVLHGTQPVAVTGDMVGTEADFLVRAIRIQPITASDWAVSFELHEVTPT